MVLYTDEWQQLLHFTGRMQLGGRMHGGGESMLGHDDPVSLHFSAWVCLDALTESVGELLLTRANA